MPSNYQLDQIINSADIVLITKTIQSIIASSLTCQSKVGYLSDFIGRIQSFIAIKSRRIDDIANIISAAKLAIDNYIIQINGYLANI